MTASPIREFFKLDDQVSTGAQPTAADLQWLAEKGFKSVLNLNTSTARSFLPDEGERLEALGVHYVHHPIDCAVLTPDLYFGFRDALRELLRHGGPVFVHCAGNVKVTGLMHLFRIFERKEPKEQVAADLAKLPSLEPKWQSFWQAMGLAT